MNKPKIYHVEGEPFKIGWTSFGMGSAVPLVKARKSFLGIHYWGLVWQGQHKPILNTEQFKPDQLGRWYMDSLNNYLEYRNAWAEVTK